MNKNYLLSILVVIITLLIAGCGEMDKATKLIQQGDYSYAKMILFNDYQEANIKAIDDDLKKIGKAIEHKQGISEPVGIRKEPVIVLYKYADARDSEAKGKIYEASEAIKNVSNDYKGPLSKEILAYKDEFLSKYASQIQQASDEKAKEEKDQKETAEQEAKERIDTWNKTINIGDLKDHVIDVLGNPKGVNTITYENGTAEQLIYSNKYVYIKNGRVTAIQTEN